MEWRKILDSKDGIIRIIGWRGERAGLDVFSVFDCKFMVGEVKNNFFIGIFWDFWVGFGGEELIRKKFSNNCISSLSQIQKKWQTRKILICI